jgi:urease accessory protein UreE
MLIIERIPAPVSFATLVAKERDTLVINSEQRRWGRWRARTSAGREVALALPTGTTLEPGTVIAVEADWYLEVEAAQEAVIAVRPHGRQAAVKLAFEVGNLHFPLALDGDTLVVPDDPAMRHLLDRLGQPWEPRRAIFNPIGLGHTHER